MYGRIALPGIILREKIEIDPNEPQVLRTVWGVGYVLTLGEG